MPKAKYKKRKDGRYATSVMIGYRPDGKPDQRTIYGKTIAELEKKKASMLVDLERGIFVKDKDMTFGEYSQRWYKNKCIGIEEQTKLMYHSVLKNYTTPLNGLPLVKITKMDCQEIINSALNKPRTCQKIKITLNQIFNSAIEDALLYKNPFKGVQLPKYKKPVKRPLTKAEDILTEVTEFTDREKMLILLLKYYGLRKEEALVLTKDNFDFEKEQLRIKNAVSLIHNQPVEKETKSDSGTRHLFLMKEHIPFFKAYLEQIGTYRIFTNQNGEWITEQGYRRMFESIIRKMTAKAKELELPPPEGLTAHVFRHNYTTMLYYAGVGIKDAQYMLGHSTASVTMDIYTHLDKENEDARNKLQNYLSSKATLEK